jgi:hypothetical protein
MRKKAPSGERFDVALIRKSSHAQDNQAQIDNVHNMLKAEGAYALHRLEPRRRGGPRG